MASIYGESAKLQTKGRESLAKTIKVLPTQDTGDILKDDERWEPA